MNSNVATGVVMSVPAHAPYDWIALENLKKDKIYGKIAKNIEVYSIIDIKDYEGIPAEDVCQQMNIKNQNDPKLEEATEQVYKKSFTQE